MGTPRIVTATRVIPAPANVIFDLLADPHQHVKLDGSGHVQQVRQAPKRLFLGAKFSMGMQWGPRYTTVNTVSAFEENRVIAWHHWAHFVWRYDLEPVEGGTKVTESFDFTKPWGILLAMTKTPQQNIVSMTKTLERLEQAVTSSS